MRSSENDDAAEARPSPVARRTGRGLCVVRVLFLGDLREAQSCLSELQAAEFNVHADVVSDAAEAAELLQRLKYGVVVTCASASTQAALGTLTALQKHQSSTPFIRIGGSDEPKVIRRFMAKGAFDCLDSAHTAQLPMCMAVALEYCSGRDAREVLMKALQRSHAEALTDELTGLTNYRGLREVLHRESSRSGRTGRPFALLMFDLDALKGINDQYGHPTGNRALCRLATALRQSCRSIDVAARCGGDEFAVVLLETSVVSAARTGRRICDHLAADGELPTLSVSVGLATFPQHGPTVDALLSAADRALYEMKRMSSGHESRITVPPAPPQAPLRGDPPMMQRRSASRPHRNRIRQSEQDSASTN